MNLELMLHKFQCPYCCGHISVMLDPSVDEQEYVEDCEICCNPIEISCAFSDHKLISFTAKTTD
ncbi:MAG: CPXCG motif-containing cysteine-rich protein [Bacteroidales bacterium]